MMHELAPGRPLAERLVVPLAVTCAWVWTRAYAARAEACCYGRNNARVESIMGKGGDTRKRRGSWTGRSRGPHAKEAATKCNNENCSTQSRGEQCTVSTHAHKDGVVTCLVCTRARRRRARHSWSGRGGARASTALRVSRCVPSRRVYICLCLCLSIYLCLSVRVCLC